MSSPLLLASGTLPPSAADTQPMMSQSELHLERGNQLTAIAGEFTIQNTVPQGAPVPVQDRPTKDLGPVGRTPPRSVFISNAAPLHPKSQHTGPSRSLLISLSLSGFGLGVFGMGLFAGVPALWISGGTISLSALLYSYTQRPTR